MKVKLSQKTYTIEPLFLSQDSYPIKKALRDNFENAIIGQYEMENNQYGIYITLYIDDITPSIIHDIESCLT